MYKKSILTVTGVIAASAFALTACSGGSGSQSGATKGDSNSLRVVFQETDTIWQQAELMKNASEEFAKDHPDIKVSLEPIAAQESEYFTKLALMNGSAATAPGVIYEDTFQVRSDAAAGYLAPLDDCVADWDEWDQFEGAASQAGLGDDGLLYGISMGTDTRGIFFNKNVFKKAGLPEDWQPANWNDIIDAAKKIKESDSDTIPISIFASKSQGEATSMQGFEMLLYGTGDALYNEETSQWVVGSDGFLESLKFLETLTTENLFPPLETQLDTNLGSIIDQKFRQDQVGIWLNGSWTPGSWMEGENAWPEWEDVVGLAKMPTNEGQQPGFNSMSGGWLLSVGSNANYDAACDFIKVALNKENSFNYDTTASQIAVRKDVAEDPEYLAANPSFGFFSDLVQYTHFRPATPDYPAISDQVQIASESVITGQASPEQAAAAYDAAITSAVGEDNILEAK